jgi:hypothetical protein
MLLKFSTKLMGTLRIAEKNFYLGCMPVKTIISFTELMVTNLLPSNVSQKMMLKISTKLMGTLRIAEKDFYLECMPVKTTIPFSI